MSTLGFIALQRRADATGADYPIAVYIDAQLIEHVETASDPRVYPVQPGSHTISIDLDGFQSKPLHVDIMAMEIVHITCQDHRKTLTRMFSLLSKSSYFVLKEDLNRTILTMEQYNNLTKRR